MAKILIVGDVESPLVRQRGEVGRMVGHETFWVSVSGAAPPGVSVFALPRIIARMRVVRQLAFPLLLYRAISFVRPDLIHVHYAYQGLGTSVVRRFHPLLVSVMGGDVLSDQSYRGFVAPSVRALLDAADCITSKSAFLDSALTRIGDYRAKIRRITWGIDLKEFQPSRNTAVLRARLGIPPGDFVFFDPRLAQPLYNKHVILQAFARYLRAGPPATLVVSEMFGGEQYRAELRQLARELGVSERVRFVGSIDQSEMADYYALADVTISVPRSDGFPQTIYEAAACGSFLILSDLSQYEEAIRDGLVVQRVPAGDAEALAAALAWIVSSPKARLEARRQGIEYVRRHANRDVEALRLRQLYDELLGTSREAALHDSSAR